LAIHERSKLGIAYLPQQTSIFRGLSVYQNLLAIAQIVKKGEAEQKNIVEKLMAEFSITHLRDVKATALSGGERRRTEIARCLINNPKVLLLDEPFAGVHPKMMEVIYEYIRRVNEQGKAMIIISHQMDSIFALCKRLLVLNYGDLIADNTPDAVKNDSVVIEAYLGSTEDRSGTGQHDAAGEAQ